MAALRFFYSFLLMITIFIFPPLYAMESELAQEVMKTDIRVESQDLTPAVSLREALTLADQYLAANHIDTSGRYLRSIQLIEAEHVRTWRVLWDSRKITDGIPLAVCVAMDRSACICGSKPITDKELQQLPIRRDVESLATLEGKLTVLDGISIPGATITLLLLF